MHTLAIIPARGGSKGIPNKNIKPLMGKPLIAWTIEQAKAAEKVHSVLVTSDSLKILNVAGEFGADHKLARPDNLSTDDATSESALEHALDWYEANHRLVDYVVFLQATSPIRHPLDIDGAIACLEKSNADSVFSARKIDGFSWSRHALWTPEYTLEHRKMRQALPQRVEENGSIYVFKPWVLRNRQARLGGRIVPYYMHPLDSFQIDEPDDWTLFESLWDLRMAWQTNQTASA